jgi:transposase
MRKDVKGYWRRHVNQLQQSGLSPVEYAKQQQISVKSLYNWRSKLSVAEVVAQPTSPFVALSVAPSRPSIPCSISLPKGVRLDLPELPATHWLASLLQQIGQEA